MSSRASASSIPARTLARSDSLPIRRSRKCVTPDSVCSFSAFRLENSSCRCLSPPVMERARFVLKSDWSCSTVSSPRRELNDCLMAALSPLSAIWYIISPSKKNKSAIPRGTSPLTKACIWSCPIMSKPVSSLPGMQTRISSAAPSLDLRHRRSTSYSSTRLLRCSMSRTATDDHSSAPANPPLLRRCISCISLFS